LSGGLALPVVAPHHFEIDYLSIDELLAGILEIDRDPISDNRLHLADTPILAGGVTDEIAGLDEERHNLSLTLSRLNAMV